VATAGVWFAAMQDLATRIGVFVIDDGSVDDCRIHVRSVEVVENRGPDSTYSWLTDQEEALLAAAASVGATAMLLVPGGWRITPGTAMPAVVHALAALAKTMAPTDRRTMG
jgi:hypothetical protein